MTNFWLVFPAKLWWFWDIWVVRLVRVVGLVREVKVLW